MVSFEFLYSTACAHKGGEASVEASLPKAKSSAALKRKQNDRYLSDMSRRIFRAGLKHEMVDKKWPAFEEAFRRFDPTYCAMLGDDQIDELLKDTRLIRHLGKIKSVRHNAQWMLNQQEASGQGFGAFLATWPVDEIVDLWITMKKRGSQLGGMSGAYFLRMVGKDTFVLTKDVVAVFIREGVVEKEPKSQRDLKAAQDAFNLWRSECGRDMCEISRIVSYTAS